MIGKRFIRNRKRRSKSEPMELELNSLLDILVILLVFLLKNYSVNEFELKINKGISIPDSVSKSMISKGVTIQLNKEFEVFVEEKLVTSLNEEGRWKYSNKIKIRNELLGLKEEIERMRMQSENIAEPTDVVNFIMDKEIDFQHINQLMKISTDAGFEQFKFIVLGS